MFSQKWPCFRAEWSELPCKAQPFATVAEKYSSNDVSPILLTDEKIFTVVTPKKTPKNHRATAAVTKKKVVTTKRLRTNDNVQTVTDGISRRITSGRENTSLILVDHRVKVIEGCYRNVMLL